MISNSISMILWLTLVTIVTVNASDNDSICTKYSEVWYQTQVISIFTLEKYIMVQVKHPWDDQTEMWQISNTEAIDPNSPDEIPDHLWQNHKFLDRFFYFEYLKHDTINYTMRVTGHVIKKPDPFETLCPGITIEATDDTKSGYTFTNDTTKPCYEVQEIYASGQQFICLYGHVPDRWYEWKLVARNARILDMTSGDITDIKHGVNHYMIDLICAGYHIRYRGMASMQYNHYYNGETFPILMGITMTAIDNVKANLRAEERVVASNSIQYKTVVNYRQVMNIFSFNTYYQLYSCPLGCRFTTRLTKMDLDKYGRKWIIQETNFSLAQILGCPWQPPTFNPLSYCSHRRAILSAFNLGPDIYFQKSGVFYRFHADGFTTNDTSAYIKKMHNICPLRLDSYMTAMMQQEGFDTDMKVMGFSVPRVYDSNTADDDMDCDPSVHNSSCVYDLVCMIGQKYMFWGKSLEDLGSDIKSESHVRAFKYYLSGIEKFKDPDRRDSARGLCYSILHKLKLYEDDDIRGIVSGLSSYYNDLYAYLYANDGVYMTALRWDIGFGSDWFRHVADLYPQHTFVIPEVVGLLVYKEELFLNTKSNSVWRNVRIKKNDYMWDTNTNINQAEDWELYTEPIVECPCNQSSSLTLVRRRAPMCQEMRNNNHSQSVFNIGTRLFQQTGQHFYEFSHHSEKVVYNKYMTELFNDYFDTRYRVTGYSPIINHFVNDTSLREFQVLIHGRSNMAYRALGQYIYALFYLRQMGEDHDLKLVPMRLPNDVNPETEANLGVVCPLVKDMFLDAWGYLEVTTEEPFVEQYSAIIMDWIEDTNMLYMIETARPARVTFPLDSNCRFNESYRQRHPQDKWVFLQSYNLDTGTYMDKRFHSISGIFSDYLHHQDMFLVAKRNDTNKMYKFLLRYVSQYSGMHPLNNFPVSLNYEDFYCPPIRTRYLTNSDQMISKILGSLLLVLLILSLLVAVMASYWKQVSDEKSLSKRTYKEDNNSTTVSDDNSI